MRASFALAATLLVASPVLAQQRANVLTPQESADGWLLLFDGATTFGWHAAGKVEAADGALVLQDGAILGPTTQFGSYDMEFEYSGRGVQRATSPAKFSKKDLKDAVSGGDLVAENEWRRRRLKVQIGPGNAEVGVVGHDSRLPEPMQLWFEAKGKLALRNLKVRPLGLQSIFNGKDLTGWKEHPGKKSKFTVAGGELNIQDGPGDVQTEGKWADFILQLECKSHGKHLNSGVFFRCIPGVYQQGYEMQIRNQFTPAATQDYIVEQYDPATNKLLGKEKVKSSAVDFGTGAIYRRVPARSDAAQDGAWFTLTLAARGRHLATWVNGIQQVDWTDHRPPADNGRNGFRAAAGPISLQGHDPTTNLSFRNFRIAELPVGK